MNNIYGKGKAVPLHTTKAQGWEEAQLLLIYGIGTKWGWVVSVTPRTRFTPGKGPPVPIGQVGGWSPEPIWTQRLEEKSTYLCQGSNFDRPVVQSIVRRNTDWDTPAPYIYGLYITYATQTIQQTCPT
jgi:hypothetical protein